MTVDGHAVVRPAPRLDERSGGARMAWTAAWAVWSIDAVRFDPGLVARAQALVGGEPLTSGLRAARRAGRAAPAAPG